MRVTESNRTELLLEPESRVGAALIVGVVFAVVAAIPLLAPGAVTLSRIATSLACGGIGVALIAFGRAPAVGVRRRVRITANGIETHAGRSPWHPSDRLRLAGRLTLDREPNYRLELVRRDGGGVVLVESGDPAAVLRDVARVVTLTGLPVTVGWGLPETARPWQGQGTPPVNHAPASLLFLARREPNLDGVAAVVGAVAAVVGGLLAREIWTRIGKGDTPQTLDLVLPTCMVLAICAVALAVKSTSLRVMDGPDTLVLEERILGVTHRRHALPRSSLRALHGVSPDSGAPVHLVLETDYGPFAVPATPVTERLRAVLGT